MGKTHWETGKGKGAAVIFSQETCLKRGISDLLSTDLFSGNGAFVHGFHVPGYHMYLRDSPGQKYQ